MTQTIHNVYMINTRNMSTCDTNVTQSVPTQILGLAKHYLQKTILYVNYNTFYTVQSDTLVTQLDTQFAKVCIFITFLCYNLLILDTVLDSLLHNSTVYHTMINNKYTYFIHIYMLQHDTNMVQVGPKCQKYAFSL